MVAEGRIVRLCSIWFNAKFRYVFSPQDIDPTYAEALQERDEGWGRGLVLWLYNDDRRDNRLATVAVSFIKNIL